MQANLTSKNQLTLPKALIERFPGVRRFEVSTRDGEIILRPAKDMDLAATWAKLEALGLAETDVADAVEWARTKKRK
jgi:bifunctional DNA-binding transcriptional regulator/antitoxin component of YhaV-PrlF toxin-antitoxin module